MKLVFCVFALLAVSLVNGIQLRGYDDVGSAERTHRLSVVLSQNPPPDNKHWATSKHTGIGRTGIHDYYGKEFPTWEKPETVLEGIDSDRLAHVLKMKPAPDNLHWAFNKKTGIGRTGIHDYYGATTPEFQ